MEQLPDQVGQGYVEGLYGGQINFKFVERIRFNPSDKTPNTDLLKVELLESKTANFKFGTIKLLVNRGAKYADAFTNEISVTQSLRHENVTQFIGSRSIPDRGLSFFMTEYAHLGPLDELIKTSPQLFDDTRFYSLSTQTITALRYLHDKSILHGAICSRNFFVTNDTESTQDHWILKVGEFERSKVSQGGQTSLSTTEGHDELIRWQAPEILLDSRPNTEVSKQGDLWSGHVFFAEILLKKTVPFEKVQPPLFTRLPIAIQAGQKPFNIPQTYPDKLQDLFRHAWDSDPEQRYDLKRVHDTLVEMKEKRGKSNIFIMEF